METKKLESLYILYNWSLTEDEENMLINSNIGDELKIETPFTPVVFKNEEKIVLPAYTSKKLIPKEFLHKYSYSKESLEIINCILLAIEKLLSQKPELCIDLISD